jgi:hypothetical protein
MFVYNLTQYRKKCQVPLSSYNSESCELKELRTGSQLGDWQVMRRLVCLKGWEELRIQTRGNNI